MPGAILALLIWVGGSFLLRFYLGATIEGPSVYGSLAAPVAVLLWLYVTALAVLIGAAVNAEVDRIWIRRGPPAEPLAEPLTEPAAVPPAAPPPRRPAEPIQAPAKN